MTFTVTYNGNGNDPGTTPPVDSTNYGNNGTVTVLAPGSLTKSGDTFAYWNTAKDGSGIVYGPGATFVISADTTLYAEWYTTQGLTNSGLGAGVTTHYAFSYDSTLQGAGIEPARTNAVIATCEADYNLMSGWFGNIQLSPKITTPYPIFVANKGGGAGGEGGSGAGTGGTYPNISSTLDPGSGAAAFLRYLIVSELTEVFMYVQNQGWYAPDGSNEQSCGEALSRFLAQQFLVVTGLGVIEPGYAISPLWLNTSLPTSNPQSTQLGTSLTTLSAPIDNIVTTFSVVKAPTEPYESTFLIQIDNEQMLVTGVNTGANTLTVTRGVNGSTAAGHSAKATVYLNYGSRADYINVTLKYDHGQDAAPGCGMLFLYYLQIQLGFTSISQIIAAAPGVSNASSCLRGVYQNLTGDPGDPFPYFRQLLDNAFPPGQFAKITGPNPDNPWPLALFQYWGVKNTYGKDEVSDLIKKSLGVYPNGFSLALDGFNLQVLGSTTPATPTIAFPGVTVAPAALLPNIIYQFPNNPKIPQRVLFNYDVHFVSPPALGAFPPEGETSAAGNASITVLLQPFPAETEFFFLAGADPYFLNVQPNPSDPSAQNVPWLSQDLRVFTATPAQPGNLIPIPSSQYVPPPQYPVPPGAPTFVENNTYGDYDIQGAYTYITNLIKYLNSAYGDPSKADPFDINNSILPGQLTAFTGDSSVAPGTNANGTTYNNYNFAIARVRLQGSTGSAGAASGVKVFFRLWQTQTADTDWNPSYTYLSDDLTGLNPQYPKAPPDNHTIPFFATDNYPVLNDAPNNQPITIQQGDTQWAYFGCFLNLYDPTFNVNGQSVQQQFAQGTHHCLVAEIAFKDAPIQNVGSATETTENCDELAQRNLQVSTSANPGNLATHRIPQTFDIRQSDAAATGQGPSTYPDELMIDWGNTPAGSLASIYWPGANAADILSIASRLYGARVLSAADNHTIQTTTTKSVTYVPIPPGTGDSLAGLLTIDLPATVVEGQEFNIVLRRIGTRRVDLPPPPSPPPATPKIATARAPRGRAQSAPAAPMAVEKNTTTERYVVGSFQVKIPVSTAKEMLPAEETTLAILKARLAAMSRKNRWYPVLLRYIGLVEARVDGLGGHADEIPPSFKGYPIGRKTSEGDTRCLEFTGKVSEVVFDCFGDFVGFVLCTCSEEHRFHSHERAICDIALRACKERLLLSVLVERGKQHKIKELVVRC